MTVHVFFGVHAQGWWQYLGDWTVKDAFDVLSKDGKGLEDWEKIHGMFTV